MEGVAGRAAQAAVDRAMAARMWNQEQEAGPTKTEVAAGLGKGEEEKRKKLGGELARGARRVVMRGRTSWVVSDPRMKEKGS